MRPMTFVRRFLVAAPALALLVVGCGSMPLAQPVSTGSPIASLDREALAESCGEPSVLRIAARGHTFDASCLSAPAGETFELRVRNHDRERTHSLDIYDGPTRLFDGDAVSGDTTSRYAVPPISEGIYAFRCAYYDEMAGRFIVS